MANIQSGDSADLVTVDPASKALRVTLYNSDGSIKDKEFSGNYSVPMEVIPAGTLADGTTYFAMRNTGSKSVWIHKIRVKIGFSGTAAASRSLFQYRRFSGATPSGGTAVAPVPFSNAYGASSVTDARFAPGGLTMTGVTFEQRFETVGVTNQINNDQAAGIDFGEHKFLLAPGEGIAVSAYGNVVAGCWHIGQISWDEN